ncbi:MAG TPA: transcription antitermination factor NusB [Nakamurella sp.]|nr:transcription antitermination factor NusB [Nakamurella sp.]
MAARSKARKRALDILYAAEAREADPLTVLDERRAAPPPLGEYAEAVVRGVAEHRTRVDELIAQHSVDWTLARMPAVDRAILRIAVWELVYSPDVPPAVAVDEAVELAKSLSTDNSPRFINGVLGQIAVIAPRLREQPHR